MFVSANPVRAILYDGSITETTLILECVAADNSGVLEIGNNHLYASRKNRSLISKRHQCDLKLRLKQRSSASERTAMTVGLSKDKIGELGFYPSHKADDITAAKGASLEALVFLDDQVFDRIFRTLSLGKKPEWVQLDIEKQDALAYGWEPDGSRIEWKIDNPNDPAYVDITNLTMGIELFRI